MTGFSLLAPLFISNHVHLIHVFYFFRADESLMRESSKASHGPRGKLWSCVMANAPPSTWQYETLEGVIKYGTLIRRQPTKAGFKGTNKMLFTSRTFMI